MNNPIVESATGLTLLGGGKSSRKQIARALRIAPFLLAADKGALKALGKGFTPDAVIGDMDSIAEIAAEIPEDRVHQVSEQQTTDFEKCLYSVSAPFVIALGVTGSRLDHSLAAINTLFRQSRVPVVVVSGKDIAFACPEKLSLHLPLGTRLSLMPMAAVRGESAGLEWPIGGIEFSPTGRIGTSNRTCDPKVDLSFDKPGMLAILPRRHLETVLGALLPSNSVY